MAIIPHITESEWLIMHELWKDSPLTAAQLVERVQAQKGLVATTIKTLLRRLISKNAVRFTIDENNAKLYYYYPNVTEEECIEKQSKHFLSLYYGGNVNKMLATFVDDSQLSGEEIDQLKDLLDAKKKTLEED
ncbi:BlaI family penicillinase repressor [Lachnospiraceae bacterium PF1-21]|uniref:BlaI/MecI/CopY family transcriptional regulator n=1 Tax=Ohessyouella blattaphilus TaxID=2949333 RepID=UPI003E260A7B